jgi:hypothetical protein
MTLDETLPVYIVQGANWDTEINLDEDDAELSPEDQRMEAATKACEVINGVIEGGYNLIDGDAAFIGAVLLVYLKGTDPEKDLYQVPAFVALANSGFYMDSLDTEKILMEELKAIQLEQQKREANNIKSIEDFKRLQSDVKNGKLNKPKRKRKNK